MKNKDWLFTVVLLMLIEYVIFNWTYSFGADKNLIDHLSFAGTIVSIILAVVAIFYSFIQAQSQSRSSTEIATQIGSLRDVVKEIDLSKIKFSGELDRISDIVAKLDVLDTHVDESSKVLNSVQSNINRLTTQLDNFKKEEAQPLPTTDTPAGQTREEGLIRKLIGASSDSYLFSYTLKLSIGKQYVENDLLFKHFGKPLADIAQIDAGGDMGEWKDTFARRASSAIQIMRFLKSFNLVEISDQVEVVTLSESLVGVLNSIDFFAILSGNSVKKGRDAIAASFVNQSD